MKVLTRSLAVSDLGLHCLPMSCFWSPVWNGSKIAIFYFLNFWQITSLRTLHAVASSNLHSCVLTICFSLMWQVPSSHALTVCSTPLWLQMCPFKSTRNINSVQYCRLKMPFLSARIFCLFNTSFIFSECASCIKTMLTATTNTHGRSLIFFLLSFFFFFFHFQCPRSTWAA